MFENNVQIREFGSKEEDGGSEVIKIGRIILNTSFISVDMADLLLYAQLHCLGGGKNRRK